MIENIEVIAFDGDDTLWDNEPYFQQAEAEFCVLLRDFYPAELVKEKLFLTEMQNLPLYGYGIKGFVLCMIETLVSLSTDSGHLIPEVIAICHELLKKPIVLLPGVSLLLEQLSERYRLVLATKGDLLDQERKLRLSGLANYFHHIQIMSHKEIENYQQLITQMDCNPSGFLMVGNSLKSDIKPVLALGGWAMHVPYHTTWMHELEHDPLPGNSRFLEMKNITEILNHLPV